ncbi:MAG TPA: hypothetical protein VMB21_20505, partial [Candidatus Limnocylindria bacterium]|nr:hypothetical protein [Candidatus Limnocylindria bacterium]
VSWLSFYHPGDEYTVWVFGSMPGMWAIFFHGNQGDIHGFLLPVLAAGVVTMSLLGLMLDAFRVSRRWFFLAWPALAVGLFLAVLALGDRPLQRASTPTEGLILYGLGALNVGLWLTIIITLMGHFCRWAWVGMLRPLIRRPGAHPHPQAAKS